MSEAVRVEPIRRRRAARRQSDPPETEARARSAALRTRRPLAMPTDPSFPSEPERALRSHRSGAVEAEDRPGPTPGGEDPPGPDDHELVRRAQRRDEDAFAELVDRHQGRAYRVARNLVPSREDALDLAQEAFLRVFRSLDRFDFRHDFTTWLYRIVTNLAIDHLRKRRPARSTAGGEEAEAEIDLTDADAPGPEDDLERRETVVAVRDCIEALAPHFRTVLALRELEGLPCTEIARIVGATHVTVRWRLHRGRKLFQEEWERRARADERTPQPHARGPEAGETPGSARARRSDTGARTSPRNEEDTSNGTA